MPKTPILKSEEQKEILRDAWKWHNELLRILMEAAKEWVRLVDIEQQAENFLNMHNLTWAFKWYHWFPANCCLSVNDCVVHGIPDDTILQNWDLLKIDIGVTYKGLITDAAVSLIIWWKEHNKEAAKLVQATHLALDKWLKTLYPWSTFLWYGKTVEQTIKDNWMSIIKNLTWHWVWLDVHEAPTIYNRPHKSLKKIIAEPWMVVALEPITAISSNSYTHGKKNEWNLYTQNRDLWAQREYTVIINDTRIEIIAWIQEYH